MKALLGFFLGIFGFIGGLFGLHRAQPLPTQPPSAQASTTLPVAANDAVASTTAGATLGFAAHYQSFSTTAIPLGDGKVSTSAKAGYVYSCTQTFQGGGANHAGTWIHGSTWNLSEKTQVEGKVYWKSATFSNVVNGAVRAITGNGLPVGESTGTFPIARTDPAYELDRNPNSVKTQSVSYSLPANPTFAKSPSCVPMGAIGVALDGVAIYNALDDAGRDAVAHEVQDLCDGHPQSAGQYHYHGPSVCMPNIDKKNTVVGYALDGFPITSLYDANGHYYTDADLDACHGTTGTYTDENGKTLTGYHYVMTEEYPYTLGCFMGTPVSSRPRGGSNGAPNQMQSGGNQSGPPQAAIDACYGKSASASCSFATPNGGVSGSCKTTANGSFACVP